MLDVDDEGRLIPHFKVKGRKKAILELLNRMKEDIKNPDGQTVFISHGDCEEDAQADVYKRQATCSSVTPSMAAIFLF